MKLLLIIIFVYMPLYAHDDMTQFDGEENVKERKKYVQFAIVLALIGLTIYSYGK